MTILSRAEREASPYYNSAATAQRRAEALALADAARKNRAAHEGRSIDDRAQVVAEGVQSPEA